MNKLNIAAVFSLMLALSAPPVIRAQGTTYISNLGATPGGSLPVAGDFWQAAQFLTGSNAGGYLLNSIQLSMADSSGAPGSFSAMLYNDVGVTGFYPGTSVGSLSGSSSPSLAGLYTFTASDTLVLAARTSYWIVLTDGTPAADGTYQWNYANTFSYSLTGGWNGTGHYQSTDGATWGFGGISGVYALFGANATPLPVPEPSALSLLALGGLWLARRMSNRLLR